MAVAFVIQVGLILLLWCGWLRCSGSCVLPGLLAELRNGFGLALQVFLQLGQIERDLLFFLGVNELVVIQDKIIRSRGLSERRAKSAVLFVRFVIT